MVSHSLVGNEVVLRVQGERSVVIIASSEVNREDITQLSHVDNGTRFKITKANVVLDFRENLRNDAGLRLVSLNGNDGASVRSLGTDTEVNVACDTSTSAYSPPSLHGCIMLTEVQVCESLVRADNECASGAS